MVKLYEPTARDRESFNVLYINAGPARARAKGARIEEPVTGHPGLYLVSQPNGAQSWAYRYRTPSGPRIGKAAKLTLGKVDISRELGPDEEPELGEGLTKAMAIALAGTCRVKVKARVDPAEWFRRQAAEIAEGGLNQSPDGPRVDTLIVKFMNDYPLTSGREARESTKEQTAMLLGLKPDGKGGWKPNGNGVLGKWTGKPLATISRKDGVALIDQLKAEVQARGKKGVSVNRTLSALKLFGRWAEDKGHWDANLFATIRNVVAEQKRKRTLYWVEEGEDEDDEQIEHAEEIAALWAAIEAAAASGQAAGYPFGRIVQLTLTTGQRPGEVRLAPWSEFHPDLPKLLRDPATDWAAVPKSVKTWTIPPARFKTGNRADADPHKVPLSLLALRVLASLPERGPFLFSADCIRPAAEQPEVKHRIDALMLAERRKLDPMATIEHWTYHDLRHTCFTGIVALGFSETLANRVTNHAVQGMEAVYGHYDFAKEKREALDAWGVKLAEIVGWKLASPVPEAA